MMVCVHSLLAIGPMHDDDVEVPVTTKVTTIQQTIIDDERRRDNISNSARCLSVCLHTLTFLSREREKESLSLAHAPAVDVIVVFPQQFSEPAGLFPKLSLSFFRRILFICVLALTSTFIEAFIFCSTYFIAF